MPTPPKLMPLLVLGVLMITPRMSAQNAFVVHEDDLFRPVREVRNGCPLIVVNGKLQMSSSPHFALIKAPFYLPGLITRPHDSCRLSRRQGPPPRGIDEDRFP